MKKVPNVAIAAILLSTTFSPLAAESSSLNDLLNISLAELVNVTVSVAERAKNPVWDTASSVTVYTRADIERMGIQSLEELLNYVPGMQSARTQEDGYYEGPIVRGRAKQHTSSPSVLLLLDGRRMNSPVVGGAFRLPLNNLKWLKQVEIIRGPGSALYGANAFMGVINLVSEIQPGNFEVSVGEYSLLETSLQFKKQIGDLSAGFYLHSKQDDGHPYEGFLNYFGTFSQTRDPFERFTLALSADYAGLSFDYYHSDAEHRDYVLGSLQGDGINQLNAVSNSVGLKYSAEITESWSIQAEASLFDQEDDAQIALLPANIAQDFWWTNGAELPAAGGNYRQWRTYDVNLMFSFLGWSEHQVQFGFDYRHESVDVIPFRGNWDGELMESSRGSIVEPCNCISRGYWFQGERADFVPESDRDVFAIWVQDRWELNKTMTNVFGMRYDNYDDFGGNLSLRNTLIKEVSSNSELKIIYGEAFRAPSLQETRAFIASNFIGNPLLEPEQIRTLDLVYAYSQPKFNVVFTYSQSRIEDQIELRLSDREVSQGVFAFEPQNASTLNLKDIELVTNVKLESNWYFKLGVTQLLKFSEIGVARTTGFFSANYALERVNLNVNAFYHSKVLSREAPGSDSSESLYLDSFWRFKVKATYQYDEDVQFFILADNALDEIYRTFSTGSNGLEFGLPSRGRQVSIGVNWDF